LALAADVSHLDADTKQEEQYDYAPPAKILGFVKVGGSITCIIHPYTVTYTIACLLG
jgi:hypothetical protein